MRTIHREIVSPFIFSNDKYILLGESRPGVYPGYMLIPGGGVESDESLLDAVKREVKEEAGLLLDDAAIEHIADNSSSDTAEKTLRDTGERVLVNMHFNIFRIDIPLPAAEIAIKAGDDFTDVEWIAFKDLPSMKLVETTKKVLRDLGILA